MVLDDLRNVSAEEIEQAVERLYMGEAQKIRDAKTRFAEVVAEVTGMDLDHTQVDQFAEMMTRLLLVNQGVSLPFRIRCATGRCRPFNWSGEWDLGSRDDVIMYTGDVAIS